MAHPRVNRREGRARQPARPPCRRPAPGQRRRRSAPPAGRRRCQGIARTGAACCGGHQSVVGEHDELTLPGEVFGIAGIEDGRLGHGECRLVIAPGKTLGIGDPDPGLDVRRFLLQPATGALHETGEFGVGGGDAAFGKGPVGEMRRPDCRIDGDRSGDDGKGGLRRPGLADAGRRPAREGAAPSGLGPPR